MMQMRKKKRKENKKVYWVSAFLTICTDTNIGKW